MNLRDKDLARESINDQNVVFDDIVDLLIAVNDDLARYEHSDRLRWSTEAGRRLEELSKMAMMFRRRLSMIRRAENKAWDDSKEERMRRAVEEKPWLSRRENYAAVTRKSP